jgi:hypothetical protein
MPKKELFSERVAAGSRTYFFDIKESVKGAKYLVISESKRSGETQERNRVLIFEEDIPAFNECMSKMVQFVLGKTLA